MQRRHPNGGGRILGDQAIVSPSVFISEESVVLYGAHVLGASSRLEGQSTVVGTAVLADALVRDSLVGKVLKPEETYSIGGRPFQPTFPFVSNSQIREGSRVENHIVCDSVIKASHLEDATEVRDGVVLEWVWLTQWANISGRAKIHGTREAPIHIHSRMHVDRGEWFVAPKYFEVGGEDDSEGIHVGVTECVDGRVNVGCWCAETKKLLEAIERRGAEHRIARAFGWRGYHVEELRGGLLEWENLAN